MGIKKPEGRREEYDQEQSSRRKKSVEKYNPRFAKNQNESSKSDVEN